ncbi:MULTISPECIES: hypothetical protein [Pseudomonas fluorescens group]|uniref:Uncharacterized protein n=1 Tax=Pseudomonas azotoformans TaxID=47878 RepID=A0A4Q0HYA8_PSEAZ|nr:MULTISPECIES: hypothetical protein [Pseudomonas fluorescens group]RXE54188.1 hypothetical protein B4O85_04920 [Pseudomonas azotoformans]
MTIEVMDSWAIAKLVAGSSFVAAITTVFCTAVKDRLAKAGEKKAAAEVEAIFLIRELDLVAVNCANAIWDHGEIFHQLEGKPEQRKYPGCSRPEISVSKESLSKIDKRIAAKLAWLENEIKLGQDQIKSAWWHDALDFYEAHQQQADLVGYFGAKAMEISSDLRAMYKLDCSHYKWGMHGVGELLTASSLRSQSYLQKHI